MLHTTFLAGYLSASLADPPGSSVIVAAVSWLQGTLLGTVATTLAVIAIATVGLMMLAGRVNIRHGLTVVVGELRCQFTKLSSRSILLPWSACRASCFPAFPIT